MLARKNSGNVGGGSDSRSSRSRSLRLKPRNSAKELLPREKETLLDRLATTLLHLTLLAYTAIIWCGESLFLPDDEAEWCEAARLGYPNVKHYANPDCNNNPCFRERPYQLLFASQMECDFARRMVISVIFGAAIGFERKAADRPAGLRTMSLVCLGACFFTMCGQIAFRSSTMGWDAARVSAAVPSGVGFLGSALIWKGSTGEKGSAEERHEVHGLTTAASVWLSASIGVGVGGRLMVVSAYAVALVLLVLRLGPRLYFAADSASFADDGDGDGETESESGSGWSTSEQAVSETTDDSDGGASEDGRGPPSTTTAGKMCGAAAVSKISGEEQIRLLMGMSASSYYGVDSERSLITESASVSNFRRFQSAPNLHDLDEEQEEKGEEGTNIGADAAEAFARASSAPLEDTTTAAASVVTEVLEVPLKDHSDLPSRRRAKKGRSKRHRRRNRSHSPRRRKYHVGFLS